MDANQTSQDSRDDLVPDKTVIVVMGVAGSGRQPSPDCSRKTWAGSRPRRMIFTTRGEAASR
jgi:hypothetical protein